MLELEHCIDSFASEHFSRILIDEVVATLDSVKHVPLPVIFLDVAQGRADATLGRARVRPRWVESAMIRDGVPCVRPTVGATLACLRATTKRFLRGPSLIAPLSAPPGGTIRVALRLPGRAAGPPSGPVVLRRVEPSPGPVPGPVVRSGDAVVLPDVAPREYRLVTLVGSGGDARGIAARITIR